MRRKIFDLVDSPVGNSKKVDVYDILMFSAIIVSIIPLAFKTQSHLFDIVEKITFSLFLIDYFLRWLTADLKLNNGIFSFLEYPFTAMAIIDLLSILPTITILNNGFRLLRLFRLARTFKAFRVFKIFRYSKNILLIMKVFRKQKDSLLAMCWLAGAYILISALLIFNVEPESFPTFFDAVYWATVSLTTVGYGDIYPITTVGRIITMISSIFGIAIIAMPAGIITAGILDEISQSNCCNK